MPMTFADHLRALPDDGLAALIALRPDLVVPIPVDISALAVRAQSRMSVARALDGLDRFTLEVLDAVRLSRDRLGGADAAGATGTAGGTGAGGTGAGGGANGAGGGDHAGGATTLRSIVSLTAPGGIDAERVRDAVERLRALCLVYGPDHALRLVASVDEICSPYPAGLGRRAEKLDPAAGALVDDPARLRRSVLAAPPAARAILDRLAAGPPIGTTAAPDSDSDSPVRWLLTQRLLVQVAADTVELPREVALLLRRESGPLGALHPHPPALPAPVRDPAAVDRAGAGQVLETVRNAGALLEAIGAEPVPALRSGGVGVRDLRRLARTAAVDEATAALLLEVCHAAGLIGEVSSSAGDATGVAFLPAAGYDAWRASPIAARWHRLARAWLVMTRAPGLVGQRDDRDRLVSALAPEAERSGAPTLRRAALGVLADAAPGCAPSTEELHEVLAWHAPRRVARLGTAPAGYAAALGEAATLGLTALGALTGYGRFLLAEVDAAMLADPDDDPLGVYTDDTPPPALELLDRLLPSPVDHVLLQADLSVVVPGPPEPTLAAELSLVADAESASVFRVTGVSVRRALDAGYTAGELHALFDRRSRTPVPQALAYLVDDTARRHGGLRIGAAGAYLRSDDEAVLAELLADRRLSSLSLRRLAPTVLVSPAAVARLLATLREAGYAPVAEDSTGVAVLTRPRLRRAPARPPVPTRRSDDPFAQPRLGGTAGPGGMAAPGLRAPRLAGIVEQIRRGEAAARAARRAPVAVRAAGGATGAQAITQAMAVLQQALRDKVRVWVGYVDAHGTPVSRLVLPVSIGAGYLRAEDERTETQHTFRLDRITAAVPEEP